MTGPLSRPSASLTGPPPDWAPPRLTCFLTGTARTGSSYLAHLMKGTGLLGWPREFFNRSIPPKYILDPSAGLPPPLAGQSASVPWRCRVLAAVGQSPNGIASTKMFADHLRWVVGQIRIAEWFPTLRFVHLRREDKLGQAISAAIAAETQVWEGHGRKPVPEPIVSAATIDSLLRYILNCESMWSAYFLRNRIEPLHLSYEELDLDPVASVERIASYLEVDLVASPGDSGPYVRQRNHLNEEWRARYLEEVADLNLADGLPKISTKRDRGPFWRFPSLTLGKRQP